MDKDTLPNPLGGGEVHYNPLRSVPLVGGLINRTVNAPLHSVGLVNEGAGNVALGAAGSVAYLLAQIMRASRAVDNDGQPNAMADLADEIATNGPLHPGRNIEALRHSPNPIVSKGAGGLEMLANPLNFTGPIGEAGAAIEAGGRLPQLGTALKGLALAGEATNRASLPIGLLTKGGREALMEAPAFMRAGGREVAPQLAQALAKLGETELPPAGPRPDLSVLRGGKIGAPEPLGLPLIPEPLDLRLAQRERGIPQATRVPDLGPSPLAPDKTPNLLNIAREAQNAAERGPLVAPQRMPGPIEPLPSDRATPVQPLGDLLGAARKGVGPNLLEQLRDTARGMGLDTPTPPPNRPRIAPITLPPGAVTRAEERAARAVPDLIESAAPPAALDFPQLAGDRRTALGQLSSDEIGTLLDLAYPGDTALGSAIAKYPDPIDLTDAALARITRDNHALATLARTDDALARKLAYLPELGEGAIQALPDAPGATEDSYPAFLDLVHSVTGDLPLPTSDFYAKKLGVAAADVPGLFKRAADEGIIGELPHEPGRFAVKPSTFTGNVDIPQVDDAASLDAARLEAIEASPYFAAFQYFNPRGDLKATNPITGKRIVTRAGGKFGTFGGGVGNVVGNGYDEVADNLSSAGRVGGHNQQYNQTAEEFWTEAQKAFREYQAIKAGPAREVPLMPGEVRVPIKGGGDIAAGGGGMGIVPYVLPAAASRSLVGAGIGGAVGGVAGALQDDEDRLGGATRGTLIGMGAGAAIANAGPVGQAGAQALATLPKALHGTVIHPDLQEGAIRAGLANQVAVDAEKGVQGAGKQIGAARSQWRAQMVNTLKQLPQDAFQQFITRWGIAGKEFGVTAADQRRWQAGLANERANGVSMLNNPVTGWFRDLGLTDKLADLGQTYGIDFGGSVTQGQDQYLSGGKRMLAGAATSGFAGGPTVNPISIAYGAVRGKYAPFIDGYIRFLNGIQHDAARFSMAEKALDRDVPALADAFLFELARAGHNVKPLEQLGGHFSAADVAAVAGPQAGKDWRALVEPLVIGQGDRIAFLNGDFRKSSETWAERKIGAVAPFSRWSIRYAPVLAEIAARHPRAALLVTQTMQQQQADAKAQGKRSYQAGVTIDDETPLVGLAARVRNGGAKGPLTLNLAGAVMPYGSLLGGGEDLPDDATGYQKVAGAADRIGLSPTPELQNLMYVLGQDYRPSSALSRTAGIEAGVEALPAAARLAGVDVPDLPQLPGGRMLLDTGRNLLKPVTGEGAVAASDPVLRRYAELVLAETRKPLSDPSNADYVTSIGEPDNDLWNRATVQARVAGAATNATGMVSPVQTTAQTNEAAAAQRAGKLPLTDYQISQAPKSQQAGLRAQLDRFVTANPVAATYRNINPNARHAQLVAAWELRNARLKQMAPALYAERRKEYEASLP